MSKKKSKVVSYKVAHRAIRLTFDDGQGTSFPWPFEFVDDENDDAAHVARYSPDRLTKRQAMELAGIADAYKTLITHPCRSVAEQIFDLRRAFQAEIKAFDKLDATVVECPTCHAFVGWACKGGGFTCHADGYHPARYRAAAVMVARGEPPSPLKHSFGCGCNACEHFRAEEGS